MENRSTDVATLIAAINATNEYLETITSNEIEDINDASAYIDECLFDLWHIQDQGVRDQIRRAAIKKRWGLNI